MKNSADNLYTVMLDYTIETNKQFAEFGTRVAKDYMEFSRNAMKLVPGMDAWTKFMPAANTTGK